MAPGFFHQFSNVVSRGAGKPLTFAAACAVIVLWAVTGPLFGFSETWQLVINTATTIITFLMVFIVQNTQNRDGEAVQAKLDDLILAVRKADNRLIGAEDLTEHELHQLRKVIAAQVPRDEDTIDETAQPNKSNAPSEPNRATRASL
jgi:low affinity Fe/Cu permease